MIPSDTTKNWAKTSQEWRGSARPTLGRSSRSLEPTLGRSSRSLEPTLGRSLDPMLGRAPRSLGHTLASALSYTRGRALVLAVAALPACHPKSGLPSATPQTRPPPTLHELLPLQDKTVSSFEMTSDRGDEGLLILEIFRPRPDMAELVIAGRTQRLLVEPHRITQMSGGIVLEEPLTKGHQFVGPFGQSTIVDTNVRVELPAGVFEQCLTTVEESTRPIKRATSTYCRDVGLVQLVVETFGDEAVRLETRLREHAPRFDIHQHEAGSTSEQVVPTAP